MVVFWMNGIGGMVGRRGVLDMLRAGGIGYRGFLGSGRDRIERCSVQRFVQRIRVGFAGCVHFVYRFGSAGCVRGLCSFMGFCFVFRSKLGGQFQLGLARIVLCRVVRCNAMGFGQFFQQRGCFGRGDLR